ncbi:hypothetical protein [Bacillus sp. FJAT-27916]|uniref:hypothetical protein n=1 Tax=Bacillus sp. FJAT-27916 TaxID=1679169 RepID=UPI0006716B25|nr:hypothetical protein [Bacillus sp. FJAT-27916]
MREEIRVKQEIEERLKVLEKEKQYYINVNASLIYRNKLEKAEDNFKKDLIRELEKSEIKLKKIEERSELDYRVRNAKAGFAYIVSNLGAFGENVFKIGMTRRLEPLDCIRELSGASIFHKRA